MLAYSIDDDWIAPVAAVDALHRSYSGCSMTRRHLIPAQLGAPRIGHFGLFRDAAAVPVWEEIGDWLIEPHARSGSAAPGIDRCASEVRAPRPSQQSTATPY
jgi:hypothetical protein